MLTEATAALNAWIEVDLGALAANVQALRETVGAAVELIAVVKANAYGAGVAGVAPALEAAGVERFAVVWLAEALQLRQLGLRRPILVLGHAFPADTMAAVKNDITLTCDSTELARALSVAAVDAGRVARIHIHIDTGLHRDGLGPEEAIALAEFARTLPGVEVEGIGTHMANADEPSDAYSVEQQRRFDAALKRLSWIPYRHSANSATALRRPEFRFDGVRVGLALHGVQPDHTPAAGLAPILSIHARVARVLEIAAGESVSYGQTWTAARASRLALIPVGYADGWRRSLGNRGAVLIRGQRAPMVGRVCMDQFVVDITDIGQALREPRASASGRSPLTDVVDGIVPGAETVLLGSQGAARITAAEVAELTGTIPWEVFAGLTGRLPRVFQRDGHVESIA